MCLVKQIEAAPYDFKPRTQPKTVVSRAQKGVGVHAEKEFLQIGSAGERGIPTDGLCDLPVDAESVFQKHIQTKTHRDQSFQKSVMALKRLELSGCYDQTAEYQADPGGCAIGKIEHPERHCQERDVHVYDPFRLPFLA